jgi:predicted nicotinamide N-methyase
MPKKWSPTQQQLLNKRNVTVGGRTVIIEQSVIGLQEGDANRGRPDVADVGKVLWPASIFLMEYLDFSVRDWSSSVDVLELGCGTGLVGLYLGLCGAKCILTDLNDVIELTKMNIEHNFPEKLEPCEPCERREGGEGGEGGIAPKVIGYDWNIEETEMCDDLRQSFDFIVASDVMYEPCNYDPLMQVIKRHCTMKTRVYIAYQLRSGAEFSYVKDHLSALGFVVGLVDTCDLPPR